MKKMILSILAFVVIALAGTYTDGQGNVFLFQDTTVTAKDKNGNAIAVLAKDTGTTMILYCFGNNEIILCSYVDGKIVSCRSLQ
jgi:hypothetical protein